MSEEMIKEWWEWIDDDEKDEERLRGLLEACGSGEERAALLLSQDMGGDTALHLAASRGYERCTRLLLLGAEGEELRGRMLLAVDVAEQTPLHQAASNGHTSCLRALLEHARGPEEQQEMLQAKDAYGDTALNLAEEGGEKEAAALLREALAGKVPCGVRGVAHSLPGSSSGPASGDTPMRAYICASCPEHLHDEVQRLCKKRRVVKAFGKKGDMVDDLAGEDWVAKWEVKVVSAVSTGVQLLDAQAANILCIAGGPHCEKEMARQAALVKAVKQELGDDSFRVKVEWMEMEDFRDLVAKLG